MHCIRCQQHHRASCLGSFWFYPILSSPVSSIRFLSAVAVMASFRNEAGDYDGALTFDEACGQVNGHRLHLENRPMRSDRALGDVSVGDLPARQLDSSATKLEHFADCLMYHPIAVTNTMFDNLDKICCEGKYAQLPAPFCLRKEPTVPYTMQIIIQSTQPPSDGDAAGTYFHIFKHIYLHRASTATRSLPRTAWTCAKATLSVLTGVPKLV